MAASELSALLWREREFLELLLFKLESEQLLLTAGKTRWLGQATREIEMVLDGLREASLARTLDAEGVATELGLPETATLRQIAGAFTEGPWSDIFAAHLAAMTELVTQIGQLRDLNDQFLRASFRATQETLAALADEAQTYDSSGTTGIQGVGAQFIDERL